MNMKEINTAKVELKKFARVMFLALAIIGTIFLLRHKTGYIWFYAFGLAFLLLGVFVPVSLKPIYIIWMRLALVLSWIMTRLILILIFYLVFTPIGLVLKLFGKDLLDRRIEKGRSSYWNVKENKSFDKSNYERQY